MSLNYYGRRISAGGKSSRLLKHTSLGLGLAICSRNVLFSFVGGSNVGSASFTTVPRSVPDHLYFDCSWE